MVGAERFELSTPWSQTRCARTGLRYAPMKKRDVVRGGGGGLFYASNPTAALARIPLATASHSRWLAAGDPGPTGISLSGERGRNIIILEDNYAFLQCVYNTILSFLGGGSGGGN